MLLRTPISTPTDTPFPYPTLFRSFGYSRTGCIASLSMKSVLPNATARIRANTSKPVFYFYFDEANARYAQNAASGVWLSGPAATVSSPNEFSLVRFKEKKNGREARVGSFNIAGAKAGMMDKIGRANVGTPITNAHLVCRLLRE